MRFQKTVLFAMIGAAAGAVNGLFGAGGGMILVPLMSLLHLFSEEEVFPVSVGVILPICLVSIITGALQGSFPFREALPYCIGSVIGGIAAGIYGQKIPIKWLHRILGIFILWGGVRYLC